MSRLILYLIATVNVLFSSCVREGQDVAYLSNSKQVFQTGIVYEPGKTIRGAFQPTVISTSNGQVHIFAQGRLYNSEDDTDKVLMYKYSEDKGKTWSTIEYLTEPGSFWGVASYLTTDPSTSNEQINLMLAFSKVKLFELYTDEELRSKFNIEPLDYLEEETSILYQLTSSDNGQTWNKGVVNETFLSNYHSDGNYISFFTPVGQVNKVTEGSYAGRILAGGVAKFSEGPIANPSDIYDYPLSASTLIYSDDNGVTWNLGGLTPYGGNEASVASIVNGDRLIMIRRRNGGDGNVKRILNYSSDGGLSWTENEVVEELASPKCLGILYDDGERLLYSTPNKDGRYRGWVGFSQDGLSWKGRVVEEGFFSYSDVERLNGTDDYLVAYSIIHHGELGISIKTFNKEWLMNGAD